MSYKKEIKRRKGFKPISPIVRFITLPVRVIVTDRGDTNHYELTESAFAAALEKAKKAGRLL